MPPMGGMGFGPHSGRQPLTAEEKANQPKVTKELLVRVMSWLKPYKLQLAASTAAAWMSRSTVGSFSGAYGIVITKTWRCPLIRSSAK